MKIVKLLRMGALLAAAIAFVGCEMTLSDEDSRKEVVEAKAEVVEAEAKANDDKGSGNGNGGGSGTDSSLPVIYVGLGGENTFNLTSVKVGDKEQTIKNSTLKPSTWNAISEFETVQVKKGSSVSFTFTQTAAGASVWNTWALAIYDNATASEAKGNFVRGDNWLNKSVDAGFKAGLWSEGGATAGGAYSNEYTSETAGKALTSSDTVVIKVEYTDSGVKITETINEKLAYTAEGAFTSSTPAPTTDNSSQAENSGNNNNSGNNGNNDSGNNGNNNSGNTENGQNGGTEATIQNTVTGEGTVDSPYVLKTTSVETYNGVESINASSAQSTKGFDTSAKIIWDNPLKNTSSNAVTVSTKIYCPSVDDVNGYDSLLTFFKSEKVSSDNKAEGPCLGIYEGGAIHGNDWAGNYFDDNSTLVKGEWVRVTIVISSEGVTYYHGNTAVASPAVTGSAVSFITSLLGMDKIAVGVGGIWPAGYVDNGSYISNDIKIYSTALTAEQVAAIN